MPAQPQATQPPADSRIQALLPGADFHDAWAVPAGQPGLSALGQFQRAVRHTPRWVAFCMDLRNRAVQLVGLKHLGRLDDASSRQAEADYRPGDRVGIFTLFENHPDELLLGDRDKHLDVTLSVHLHRTAAQTLVTLSTVVHTHNRLGRLYMLPVTPMHKRIAPAVLRAIAAPAPA